MNGDKAFDCLQKINADVPVLLITGFADDTEGVERLMSGDTGYLIKPFHLENLLGKVREIVSHSKQS